MAAGEAKRADERVTASSLGWGVFQFSAKKALKDFLLAIPPRSHLRGHTYLEMDREEESHQSLPWRMARFCGLVLLDLGLNPHLSLIYGGSSSFGPLLGGTNRCTSRKFTEKPNMVEGMDDGSVDSDDSNLIVITY